MKKLSYKLLLYIIISIALFSCAEKKKTSQSSIKIIPFGVTASGDSVKVFRLTNPNGAYIDVINYGVRVIRIVVPNKNGKLGDVVVGYDSLKDFATGKDNDFGALLGRYANRIANGEFTLDSVEYHLSCNEKVNNHQNTLHGGTKGFDRVMWNAVPFKRQDTVGIHFSRMSPNGEDGFPGNLYSKITFFWTPGNTLRVELRATTNKPTIVNLSQHIYFNLKGSPDRSVLDEFLTIRADSFTPVNKSYVPTGKIVPVSGTPLDFREPHTLKERINQPSKELQIMGGYSANWVLNNQSGELAKAATLYAPISGRVLQVWTTAPGLYVYAGTGLSENIIGKYGPLTKYGGIVFEPGDYPDSPNHPNFPSSVLRPDEEYHSVIEYRFSVKNKLKDDN